MPRRPTIRLDSVLPSEVVLRAEAVKLEVEEDALAIADDNAGEAGGVSPD